MFVLVPATLGHYGCKHADIAEDLPQAKNATEATVKQPLLRSHPHTEDDSQLTSQRPEPPPCERKVSTTPRTSAKMHKNASIYY
eukprot:299784-Amphidinium_carterae.1